MRLLRLADVEAGPNDRVFFYSRTRALIFMFVVLGGAAWLLLHAYVAHWKPGYYIGGVIILFLELLRRFVSARFRPTNWLVRMNDEGIYIQFRSYLNYHLPPEDLTVVFIRFGEIASARLVKERVTVPDPQGHGGTTQYLRYVELELEGDTTPLAKALDAEFYERAPEEKRWYGTSSTLYQDYPVRLQSPPFLRLHWQVVPGAKRFLEALRPYTIISDPVSLKQDFLHLEALDREEQEKRLRELVRRGDTISATYIIRKLKGCSLTEADSIVNELKSGAPVEASKLSRT